MISVIIPLYNKETAIARCIKSVIDQTMTDWELIIVDDGSTDNSSSVVSSFLKNERIKYFLKDNGGVSSARNYGVEHSHGEWIIFLDADDYFLADALQILYDAVVNSHVMVGTANFYIEKDNLRRRFSRVIKDKVIASNYRDMYMRRFLLRTGASIFHKSIIEHHLFNERLSRYEDMESILNIMRTNKIAYSGKCVMVYSQDNTGLSHKAADIRMDFISCMDFERKSFWEKIQLASLLNQGLRLYTEEKSFLRSYYKPYLYLARFERLMSYYNRGWNFLFRNLQALARCHS